MDQSTANSVACAIVWYRLVYYNALLAGMFRSYLDTLQLAACPELPCMPLSSYQTSS